MPLIIVNDDLGDDDGIVIIRGCPCLEESNGEAFCLNGLNNELREVFHCDIDKGLIEILMQYDNHNDDVCFNSVYLGDNDTVYCLSQKVPITLKDHSLRASQLNAAIDILRPLAAKRELEICNSCMYKLLTSLVENGMTALSS